MTEALIAVASLTLMALFIWATLRYFRRIRDGRADPLVSPSWTNDMRPTSPHPLDPEDPPRTHRP